MQSCARLIVIGITAFSFSVNCLQKFNGDCEPHCHPYVVLQNCLYLHYVSINRNLSLTVVSYEVDICNIFFVTR